MSIEQARLFIQRVHNDDDFRARILAEADVDLRMQLIRREGFDCTAEEIAAALLAMSAAMLEGMGDRRRLAPVRAPNRTPGTRGTSSTRTDAAG